MTNILKLQKRGCSFASDIKLQKLSDVNNYRVATDREVPGKDGKMYILEFSSCTKYNYRTTSKRTGAKLKKMVKELVKENCLHMDNQYTDIKGTCCNWELGAQVGEMNLNYDKENILKVVNSLSSKHYTGIKFTN